MIRVHIITWLCGRAVFAWQYLSGAQAAKLPHLTPTMIATKGAALAKVAAVTGAVWCSQAVIIPSTPADYVPPTPGRDAIPMAGPIGKGVDLRGVDFRRSGLAMQAAPEPSALGVLVVGIGGVLWVRRPKANGSVGK